MKSYNIKNYIRYKQDLEQANKKVKETNIFCSRSINYKY